MQAAQITWKNANTPCSPAFGDVYFSPKDGVAETEYVFLQHNQLPQRFVQASHFTLGETGFGTGLNFFVTLEHWQKQAAETATLDYVSVEKHPLSIQDLQRLYQNHPRWQPWVAHLLAHYPPLIRGCHVILFAPLRVRLLLCFGDATEQLRTILTKVDAWYLDGFAPRKNPDLWTPALFAEIARLSHPGTTLATFTAASAVYKGLTAAGFALQKSKGFGHKREMIWGHHG